MYRPAKLGQLSELLKEMLLRHSRPDFSHSDSYLTTLGCICGQPYWGDSYYKTSDEFSILTSYLKKQVQLLWWLSGKESACQGRRLGINPWVRKIPREGNGNPLQYSCLGHPMARGTSQGIVHGVTKESDTT